MTVPLRVVVAGAVANKPANGGNACVAVAWARGLAALGASVWFVEELEAPAERAPGEGAGYFDEVWTSAGLAGRSTLIDVKGRPLAGAPPEAAADFANGADLLVNLSGHLTWPPVLDGVRRRAYVDLDPGYTQFWHAAGAGDLGLERHDAHFTVGLNVGTRDCAVPTGGIRWHPVRQPVLTEAWRAEPPLCEPRFTTVASWRGAFGPVESAGRRYGLKAHQFRRFAELPRVLPLPAEIALDIHPADARDRQLLLRSGWRLVDPVEVARTPSAFRAYVEGSAAELSVAQGIYVETGCGWFSDRSVRYLASGRPVVVQDTGFGVQLPLGEGLFAFRTVAEAAAAAHAIASDRDRHGLAARRIAEEFFDARKVLPAFLERALAGPNRLRVPRPRAPAAVLSHPSRSAALDASGWEASHASGPKASRAAGPASLSRPVVVSGMVARVPGQGGASWAVLQYVLGLRQLGRSVHLIEAIPPSALTPAGVAFEESDNARYFRSVVQAFGLEGEATLLLAGSERTVGLPYADLVRLCTEAGVLLDLSGSLVDAELAGRPHARVYLDLDPGFTQLWQATEGVDMRLDGHTHFATVGLELGTGGDCVVPTCGVTWIRILPPIVLSEWGAAHGRAQRGWTTVAHWRGYGAIRRGDTVYGQKAHAFRALFELPPRTGDRFEVALSIHPDEQADLRALRENRWRLLDPTWVAGSPERYRQFVRSSAAEVGIAKGGYVTSRCGWFSDRSACYLAAGRPVLAQRTGFERHLPTGVGLVTFDGLEEAVEGVAAVRADYAAHARAARRIAEHYLDSNRVLADLLREVEA